MEKDTIKINFDWFKDFIINVKLFFNSKYWIMNNVYCKEWDGELNQLMELHNFTNINHYWATLGNTEIWVANHPYASFTKYIRGYGDVRPSRLTIYKAKIKLEMDRKNSSLIPINRNEYLTTNPCNEIPLAVQGGEVMLSMGIISGTTINGEINYETKLTPIIPETLNNGIPSSWDDKI